MTIGTTSVRQLLLRRKEILFNFGFIVTVPLIFRFLGDRAIALAEPVGFGGLVARLAGRGGWTDIGWEVVSARALVDPNFSAYAPLSVLDPLIGMGWPADQANSHPPFGIPPFILLALLDYEWWLPFWITGSVIALALSMRALNVEAWVAYPVAFAFSITFSGLFALQSTYPLSAVLLALAWRWRHRPLLGGLTLAGYGVGRGYGLILLIYPFLRRRWSLLIVATGTVVFLTATAWLLEPAVFASFLTQGRESIETNLSRGDLITPLSLASQRGIPDLLVYLAAGLAAALMLWRKQHLFWVLTWFSFAITPIAWYHSAVVGIPLLVVLWRTSVVGRMAVILTAGAFAATTTYMSYSWLVLVLTSGFVLLWNKQSNSDDPSHEAGYVRASASQRNEVQRSA